MIVSIFVVLLLAIVHGGLVQDDRLAGIQEENGGNDRARETRGCSVVGTVCWDGTVLTQERVKAEEERSRAEERIGKKSQRWQDNQDYQASKRKYWNKITLKEGKLNCTHGRERHFCYVDDVDTTLQRAICTDAVGEPESKYLCFSAESVFGSN